MANRLSSDMDGATTRVDSDNTSLSLPLHVPMDVQTYYEKFCKIQPLARSNFIVSTLSIMKESSSQEKYDFVVAEVKHLRGHDISNQLKYLVIECSLYSPIGSSSSSSAKHIVSQSSASNGDRSAGATQNFTLDTSPNTDIRNLCSLQELFRIVTIISKNSHLYSTDIDATFWFAATIMEAVRAIFPPPLTYQEINEGWFKRTIRRRKLLKPQSECGRQIVAAYWADKKKNPIPTPSSQSKESNVASASGNEKKKKEV